MITILKNGKKKQIKEKKKWYHLISYQPEAIINDLSLYNFLDFCLSKHTSPVLGINSVSLNNCWHSIGPYEQENSRHTHRSIPTFPRKLGANSVLGEI